MDICFAGNSQDMAGNCKNNHRSNKKGGSGICLSQYFTIQGISWYDMICKVSDHTSHVTSEEHSQ